LYFAGCNSCANNSFENTGFTSTSDILYSLEETDFTLLPTRVSQSDSEDINFQRWLFPNTLVFSCSGNLSGWIFRGEVVSNVSTISNLPLLQVFYDSTQAIGMPKYSIRPGSRAIPSVSNRSTNGVYEYTLPSPVEVQKGDVVMIQYQQNPQQDRNSLQMAFKADNFTDTVSIRDRRGGDLIMIAESIFQQHDDQYLPILTALMGEPIATNTTAITPEYVDNTLSLRWECMQSSDSEKIEKYLLHFSQLLCCISYFLGQSSLVLPAPSSSFLSSTMTMPQSSLQVAPSQTTLHVTHDDMASSNDYYITETPPAILCTPLTDRSLVMFGLGVLVGLVSALLVASIAVIALVLACKVKKLHQVNMKPSNKLTLSEEITCNHSGMWWK